MSQNLEREIVTVQFQTMGPQGSPGISPTDWVDDTDLRRDPRIILVLRSEDMREFLLEHVESLKLFFFLTVNPRKEECLLHGIFNIQSREQRRSVSSLEQYFESNRVTLQQTVREAVGLDEDVKRVTESRDGVLNGFVLSVPDPFRRRVLCFALGFSLSVPDPEGRVLCCTFGFSLSVPDPEGRVLHCVIGFSFSVPDLDGHLVLVTVSWW